MAYKIRLKRDTKANWESNDPVLLLGEPGVETDTKMIKVGDGTSTWLNLDYINVEGVDGGNAIGE